MMLAGTAALRNGLSSDPARMAVDLGRSYGPWVRTAILLLMINAAPLGTTAISLSFFE